MARKPPAHPTLKRISTSPLVDPAVCSLVVIAPTSADFAALPLPVRNPLHGRFATLSTAATIVGVPVFVWSPASNLKEHALVDEMGRGEAREFLAGDHLSPWLNREFVDALCAADRAVLVLAGFWLEHEVVATALHALAESYDVYIPVDATPPRAPIAEQATRARCLQAGATPVTASQVIHEWSLEAPEATQRTALFSLLSFLAHP